MRFNDFNSTAKEPQKLGPSGQLDQAEAYIILNLSVLWLHFKGLGSPHHFRFLHYQDIRKKLDFSHLRKIVLTSTTLALSVQATLTNEPRP